MFFSLRASSICLILSAWPIESTIKSNLTLLEAGILSVVSLFAGDVEGAFGASEALAGGGLGGRAGSRGQG